jgi:tetratricopeptide (TPR) repeat protein
MGANDDHSSNTGALPFDELPAVERTGFPYSLKTYKLVRQLRHDLVDGPARQHAARRVPLTLAERVSHPSCAPEQGAGSSKGSCPGISQAWDHFSAGELQDAEARFEELGAQFPDDPVVHLEVAVYEKRRGRLDEAAVALARARELDPNSPEILLEVAEIGVRNRADGGPADGAREIELLRNIMQLIPDDPRPHLLMAEHLPMEERLGELLVALELDPDRELPRVFVAATYRQLGREDLAEEHLLEALRRRDPAEPACMACVFLLDSAFPATRTEELDALVARQLDARPEDDVILSQCAGYYRSRGRVDYAEELDDRAARLREDTLHPMLRDNYLLLWEELNARGVSLVAVQYPRLPVAPLEQIFLSEPGPIIVDNRATFSRALEQHTYSDLFIDRGYGTFGHATALGDRLIAENVADAILEELELVDD